MKNVFKIAVISLLLLSCSILRNSNKEVVVVTKKENLDKYVGQYITIKGEISYKFISTIIGVDVSCNNAFKENKNLQGIQAKASGVLIKTVIKKVNPYSQNRGKGTFYRLKDPETGFDAEVKF